MPHAPSAVARLKVINIISHSYSGSTWVNLVLGSHPEAFSVGELKAIFKTGRPVCTICGSDCCFWNRFVLGTAENPLIQLQRLTGKRVLVMNNSRKFLPAQQDARIDSYFLHLLRDGRAVTASVLRKRPSVRMWQAAWTWRREVRRNLRLIRRQPGARRLTLNYEAALADPSTIFARLCRWIGLDWDPSMLRYWEPEHHYLGGNRGTLFAMMKRVDPAARPSAAPAPTPVNWDFDYYAKADPVRFVDRRWRRELTHRQLLTFGLLAGGLNRRFGYPRSGRAESLVAAGRQ